MRLLGSVMDGGKDGKKEGPRDPEIKDILSALMLGLNSEMLMYSVSKYIILLLFSLILQQNIHGSCG